MHGWGGYGAQIHEVVRHQQRAGNRSLEGKQSYAFSEDGFRTWGAVHNASVLWTGVLTVAETRGYFFIYLSEVQAHFVRSTPSLPSRSRSFAA
jgi:hypothetical protein